MTVPGKAARWFVVAEIACYFFYSIWWRADVPLWMGVALGAVHLGGLVFLLGVWERYRQDITLQPVLDPPHSGNHRSWLLVLCLLIACTVQLFFLDDPVLTGPDEPIMIVDHFVQFSLFAEMNWYLELGFLICCSGLAMAAVRLCASNPLQRLSPNTFVNLLHTKWRWVFAICIFLAFFSLLEASSPFYWGLSKRWPPLGTVLSMPFQYVAADSIWGIRWLSLAFYLGTGYLVYRIALDSWGFWSAIICLVVLLSAPVFFLYGHYGFRESGGAFFAALTVYYLQRFLRSSDSEDYALALVAVTLGYLQRRPTLVMLFLVGIVVLLVYRQKCFSLVNLRALLLPALCVVWIIAPWYLLSANIRPYSPDWSNLANVAHWVANPSALPEVAGWPLTVFCLLGLLISAVKRSLLGFVLMLWFVFYILLYALDVTAPKVVNRFYVQLIPPLVLLSGFLFRLLIPSLPGQAKAGPALCVFAVLVSVASSAAWMFDDRRSWSLVPKSGMRWVDEPLYPYDQLADYLGGEDAAFVLYQPQPYQTALPAYLKIRQIKNVELKQASWDLLGKPQPFQAAITACRSAGCSHLVQPLLRDGELFFHRGEYLGEYRSLSAIREVRTFSNRHGGVALIAITPLENHEQSGRE